MCKSYFTPPHHFQQKEKQEQKLKKKEYVSLKLLSKKILKG